MRYINQLQADNAALEAELRALWQQIRELRIYVCSAKFDGPNPEDRLVNRDDILLRLP